MNFVNRSNIEITYVRIPTNSETVYQDLDSRQPVEVEVDWIILQVVRDKWDKLHCLESDLKVLLLAIN